MAGDWIKMGKDLLTHPKVVRMSSALRADKLRTVGGLFAVWCLFDTHSADGQLSGYTAETIDDEIRFPGFCAAMEAVGWLEARTDGAYLPDFEEHNGQSAKRRAQETERKRNERKTSAPDADKKRTREEKRREEKNSSSLRSEEDEASAPRKPAADAAPPALTVSDLISEGAQEQHARDWLKVRAKHKAPLTQTAWDQHKGECLKAGITPGQGVQVCAAASWRGLDHTWNWRKFLPDAQAQAAPKQSKFGGCDAVEPA